MDEPRVRMFWAWDVEQRHMWPTLELWLFVHELAPLWRRPGRFIARQ